MHIADFVQCKSFLKCSSPIAVMAPPVFQYCHLKCWGVATGSSVSWVVKFKGDNKISECKLSNGWSRSYKVIKLLFPQGNEWSRSYREINQHPSLPRNFITMDFWAPPRFLKCLTSRASPFGLPRESFKVILNLKSFYFYLARLFLETLQRKNLKTNIKLTFPRLFLPRNVIFALQGQRLKIARKYS